jgi:signal transduction histidine kinase
VVVLGSANSHPAPGLHGKGLAVTLALCVFAATLLIAIRDSFPERSLRPQAAVIAVMGAAGVAIAGLQLKGATGVAAGVAAFFALTRLPFKAGVALAGAVTVALAVVTALAGSSSSAVAAEVLVTVLLGVVAQFLRRSWESQDQTELLMAELEDARDEQARAAAIAERGRIAGELHDVLAHSLSGAAIQLQGRASSPTANTPPRVSVTRSTAPASSSGRDLPTPARPSAHCAKTRCLLSPSLHR